ncbi:MAG: glycosyltransferase family 2 protein [Oscillospiraceae bacterium]|nr:glycosyltransferase family 2 protein [Oscillospiraceae bacterium]
MEKICVVVPCYNEEESLPMFYEEISRIAEEMGKEHPLEFEFLFVNDGSKDKTLELIKGYSAKDERVRYISFSRNFGKEAGILAGLKGSDGDYCVVIDADLQHPPALIPQMYSYVHDEGYDCAATRRVSRKGEPKLLSFFSSMFYKVINSISDTHIIDGAQDYRFMTRAMVDSIVALPEYNRFSKGIFSWVGFDTKFIPIENVERKAGKSTWNFRSLFRYSMEGIFAFSTVPLSFCTWLGVSFCLVALAVMTATLVKKIFFGENVSGYPTIITLVSVLSGVQLLCTGIIAQYIAKMYIEVKHRPKFIPKETNLESDRVKKL